MQRGKTILLVAFIVLCISYSQAQQYPFVHYTPTDGLVNNRCRLMFQDSRGRLYITTHGGLSIYDGARFTNYTTNNGLAESVVNDVVEMAEDSIWIIPNGNKINCLVNGKLKDIITSDRFYPVVNKLIKCSDGFYYALADEGLFRFKDNRFIKIHLKDKNGIELNGYFIKGFEINNKLFLVTDPTTSNSEAAARLVVFDLKSSETLISKKPPGFLYVIESPQKDILVSTFEGMKTLDQVALSKGYISFAPLPKLYKAAEKIIAIHIYFDRQQNCWISTSFEGVYKIDKEGQLKLFNTENGLPANPHFSVFQDKENIMWFLNVRTGMSKLSIPSFQSYAEIKPGFVVSDIYANKQSDSVWFLDALQNKILVQNQNRWQQFFIRKMSDLKYEYHIGRIGKSYLVDGWHVYQFNNSVVNAPIMPRLIYSQDTTSKFGIGYASVDKNGNLLFCSDKIHVVTQKNKVISYPVGYLADQFVISEDNYLWIVTRADKLFLFRIHPEDPDKYFELVKEYDKEIKGLGPRSITIDKHGTVWMGSRTKGLFRFTFDKNWNLISSENITTKDGLSDNFITYLHCDEDGTIWCCSHAGLDKVQYKNDKMVVENITRANNLFQDVTKIQTDKKGIHWICSNGGVIKIEPEVSLSKDFQPKIFFSEIKAGKDTIGSRSTKVSLSYKENHMAFHLAAPSFINEKQTLFSYRLEGSANSNWSEPSSNSEIRFVNLAPGDYKLHVKAAFPSGLYPGTEDLFHFEILPPWWQTWWFRILLICTAIVVTMIFVRSYFRRKIRKQREKQQVIEEERRRIAGEMHDDLGAGLSTIRFLSEKVKRDSSNTPTQYDADKIVVNSNDLVQKMNEIIWAMNEKNDTLEDLIFYTRAYAMEYCEENNLGCKVMLPESIPEKFVSGEIRRNIFLTVKESLHNVVKHSGASTVIIEFKVDKYLSVSISDDGRGMNGENIDQSGDGLINMQRRISLLRGTMEIKSTEGVTVEFSVPI